MSPCRLSLATFKLAVKTSRRDSSSSAQKTHLPLGASSATPQLPIPAKSSVKVKAAVVAVVGVEKGGHSFEKIAEGMPARGKGAGARSG